MIIKELTQAKIDSIASAYMNVFNGPPWHDNWSLESATNRLEEIVMTPHFHGFFAEIDQTVIGAVLGHLSTGSDARKVYYMSEFFTVEAYRRQHIGQKLYDTLLEHLRENNCSNMFLTTKKDTPAFHFYLKNGLFELKDNAVMFGTKL